eukprot:6571258-Pyramimonas_sp.AAC.1
MLHAAAAGERERSGRRPRPLEGPGSPTSSPPRGRRSRSGGRILFHDGVSLVLYTNSSNDNRNHNEST